MLYVLTYNMTHTKCYSMWYATNHGIMWQIYYIKVSSTMSLML